MIEYTKKSDDWDKISLLIDNVARYCNSPAYDFTKYINVKDGKVFTTNKATLVETDIELEDGHYKVVKNNKTKKIIEKYETAFSVASYSMDKKGYRHFEIKNYSLENKTEFNGVKLNMEHTPASKILYKLCRAGILINYEYLIKVLSPIVTFFNVYYCENDDPVFIRGVRNGITVYRAKIMGFNKEIIGIE